MSLIELSTIIPRQSLLTLRMRLLTTIRGSRLTGKVPMKKQSIVSQRPLNLKVARQTSTITEGLLIERNATFKLRYKTTQQRFSWTLTTLRLITIELFVTTRSTD